MPEIISLPFENEDQAIAFIKANQHTANWVTAARESSAFLRALVLGENFKEVLVEKIENLESESRAKARRRYSKDIRDMFERVMQPRENIFSASGGSTQIRMTNEGQKKIFIDHIDKFKGQKGIKKYLADNYFEMVDTDPNGLIFVEYIENKKIYPTYKSIRDIRTYVSDGQLLSVLLFEPVKVFVRESGLTIKRWRLVDAKKDWSFIEHNGSFTLEAAKTFEHPFGIVPGIILSDRVKKGSECRYSPLFPIEKLAEDYARDKSIKTIYKFQHGFPIHWRYKQPCRQCHGVGKNGEEICKVCNGMGEVKRNDVTDVVTLDLPSDKDDAIVTPNVTGFVSPDITTWKQYNEDAMTDEERIENTIWGTHRKREGASETATGRYIDTQPVINKLNGMSDTVEMIHNHLANWVVNWTLGQPATELQYHISYGRRFIIESADVVMERYTKARVDGAPSTILDKLLDEFLEAKFQNDQIMLEEAMKKRAIEPYIHEKLIDVSEVFGAKEAAKKPVFEKFWERADKTKTVEQLETDWATYFTANAPAPPPLPPTPPAK